MEKQLLIESMDFVPMASYLTEAAGSTPSRLRVKGKFQHEGVKNANGRIYPSGLWRKIAESKDCIKRINERENLAELDHPGDGVTKLQRVSHLITSLEVLP